MTEEPTRRSVLGGLGAGLAQLLFQTQLRAATPLTAQTGKPGQLDLSLTAMVMTERVLRMSIAPVIAKPPSTELGVVESPLEAALGGGSAADVVNWGEYKIRVEETPFRITVTDAAQQIRQQIQFDLESTAVRFRLGHRPVFGLGEGLTELERMGTKDEMHNGQGSSDLRIAGSRVPIPWVMSAEGWGVFVA